MAETMVVTSKPPWVLDTDWKNMQGPRGVVIDARSFANAKVISSHKDYCNTDHRFRRGP